MARVRRGRAETGDPPEALLSAAHQRCPFRPWDNPIRRPGFYVYQQGDPEMSRSCRFPCPGPKLEGIRVRPHPASPHRLFCRRPGQRSPRLGFSPTLNRQQFAAHRSKGWESGQDEGPAGASSGIPSMAMKSAAAVRTEAVDKVQAGRENSRTPGGLKLRRRNGNTKINRPIAAPRLRRQKNDVHTRPVTIDACGSRQGISQLT